MQRKAQAGEALKTFVLELGVPEELTVDGLKEQNMPGTDFMTCCRENGIKVHRAKVEHLNHDPAEGVIWEVRR
jgi:hypothetical protein